MCAAFVIAFINSVANASLLRGVPSIKTTAATSIARAVSIITQVELQVSSAAATALIMDVAEAVAISLLCCALSLSLNLSALPVLPSFLFSMNAGRE